MFDEDEDDDWIPSQLISDSHEVPSEKKERIARISLKDKIRYSEIWLFDETEDLYLLNRRNYKVSISVGLMDKEMHAVKGGFDTGTGLSLIREYFLEAEGLKAIQSNSRPSLKNDINQKISVVRTINLYVRMS